VARVYVTCPNGSGNIHKLVHFAICRILSDSRHQIRHDCPTHSPYVNNLHRCMNDFLDGGEDYWLSMDDDNPPTRNPLDLIDLDLDIIGLPTPVWHSAKLGDRPFYFNALREVPEGFKPLDPSEWQGLQEVDAIGSGSFLVSRRVIESLRDQQPFARRWNTDGTVDVGCDFAFCQRARAAGWRIWAHFDYLCEHIQTLPLLEVIRSFAAIESECNSGPS